MSYLIKELCTKRFSVYVGGEFERFTNFMGFIKLLSAYSDFFEYSNLEQVNFLKMLYKNKVKNVDCNICVKIN